MRRSAAGWGLPVLITLALVAAFPARTLAAEDEAAAMYTPNAVVAIALTLPQASEEALEADPLGDYQEGFFSMATSDGTPAGIGAFSTPIKVGIRLKGGTGSFKPLGEKAAFKVKFSYVKKQKFLGLKKLTLNNMVQDPSMIHESLAYQAFRAAGVPGPRTGYAVVSLNGEPLGVYLNVEDLDDVALEKRFGEFDDPQHLYEGEYGADVFPGADQLGEEEGGFQVDEGDETDRSDLQALIAAVNDDSAPAFSQRVAPHADLAEMTRQWAVEKYVGHWDGYAGEKSRPGTPLPNNYYLYGDAAGRFQMLPWGTDQTWEEHLDFGGAAGLMFDRCRADAACFAQYREAVSSARGAISGLGLDSLAASTADLLRPWQELEQGYPDHVHSLGEIEDGVAAVRAFIASRPAQADAWIEATRPPEQTTAVAATSAASTARQPSAPAAKPLRVGASWIAGGVLRTRVRIAGPGLITQVATIPGRGRTLTACSARERAAGPGKLTLDCPLSALARERRQRVGLKLAITTRFDPASGRNEVVSGRLVVSRH